MEPPAVAAETTDPPVTAQRAKKKRTRRNDPTIPYKPFLRLVRELLFELQPDTRIASVCAVRSVAQTLG